MYAIVVTLQLEAGQLSAFFPLMQKNARTSLAQEPGCQRFDVCTDPARSDEVFLYELYEDEAAFKAHLESPHFKDFDMKTKGMIASKEVRSYAQVLA